MGVWEGCVKLRQQQEDCHAAAAAAACLPPLTPLLHAIFQSCVSLAFNRNWQFFGEEVHDGSYLRLYSIISRKYQPKLPVLSL